MIKEGQSILDFINFFPLQAVDVRRAPLTNKEAQSLYEVWESEKDQWGNSLVPDTVDSGIIASLISKGYIEGTRNVASVLESNQRSVGITKKGKDVIRNIILMTEKNSFDKESGYKKIVDYENIHRALTGGKTASSWLSKITKTSQLEQRGDFADVDLRRLDGYLAEIAGYVSSAQQIVSAMKDEEASSRLNDDPTRFSVSDAVSKARYAFQRISEYGRYLEDVVNTAMQSPDYADYEEPENGIDTPVA